MPDFCGEKALLMERVQTALMTLAKIARDKERLLGAYHQHIEDHGC